MPDSSGWRVHDLDHRLRSSARLSTARPNYYLPNYYLPNYYLPEVARVGGKPKIVSQRCFGKAADIEAAVAGATPAPRPGPTSPWPRLTGSATAAPSSPYAPVIANSDVERPCQVGQSGACGAPFGRA